MPNLFILILQIAIVLLACRVVGAAFRWLHQPAVVGEMFAGILLGPSLLGWLVPHFSTLVFPPASLGYLDALSQVGLIIFMFLVGVSISPAELRAQRHMTVLTSHVSITAPFVLATLLALYLYHNLSDDSVPFSNFALFMGAAMSITAFPVLARILAARNMLKSKLGTVAIACAAVDDVTGWCILAYIVLRVRAGNESHSIWLSYLGIVAFVLFVIFAVRPLLRVFEAKFREQNALHEDSFVALLLVVFGFALCTQALGIHLLFGAFLAGAIMPKAPDFVRYLRHRLELMTLVLLPLFFALTGLRSNIGLIVGWQDWFYFSLILAVAIIGKLGSSMLAAHIMGMSWREAGVLGSLMNTRGLMELVILNIGMEIGVISQQLFSMMVMMALITTFLTSSLLSLLYREEPAKDILDGIAKARAISPMSAKPVTDRTKTPHPVSTFAKTAL